ncbi:MAG: hypothetical protein N2B06_17250 [Clostridium sp.]
MIFIDKLFSPNPKCIIFAFGLFAAYMYVSGENSNIGIGILVFFSAYISMAWYDWAYNCDRKLKSGTFPLMSVDSIFKPNDFLPLAEQERLRRRNIYLFHVAFVAPLMIYIGWKRPTDPKLYSFLLATGIIAGLYHSSKLYMGTSSINSTVVSAATSATNAVINQGQTVANTEDVRPTASAQAVPLIRTMDHDYDGSPGGLRMPGVDEPDFVLY